MIVHRLVRVHPADLAVAFAKSVGGFAKSVCFSQHLETRVEAIAWWYLCRNQIIPGVLRCRISSIRSRLDPPSGWFSFWLFPQNSHFGFPLKEPKGGSRKRHTHFNSRLWHFERGLQRGWRPLIWLVIGVTDSPLRPFQATCFPF